MVMMVNVTMVVLSIRDAYRVTPRKPGGGFHDISSDFVDVFSH